MPSPRVIRIGRWEQKRRHHLRLVTTDDAERNLPRTRGDCVDGPRPCPYVSCQYHTGLDVTIGGGIAMHFVDDVDELSETCVLDVADSGGASVADVAAALGVSRERVRQLEESGVKKLERFKKELKER